MKKTKKDLIKEKMEQGKINFALLSNRALVSDYRNFDGIVREKIGKIILVKTSKEKSWKDEKQGVELILRPLYATYIEGYVEQKRYPIDIVNGEFFGLEFGKDFADWVEMYNIGAEIRKALIIKKMRAIRKSADPKFYQLYKTLKDKLRLLDPDNPEIRIGIFGKPILGNPLGG